MALSIPSRGVPGGLSGDTHDLETSVAKMAKIRACWSPSFSPDGGRIAFVSDLNGVPQVWIVNADGGWPELITSLDDPIDNVSWSPDGAWLAFTVAPGGGLNQQVHLIHPDGSGLRRLTDGGKENNWLGPWTPDGGALTISSNRRTAEAMEPYLIGVRDGEMRMIAENRGIGWVTDVSRDRRYAVFYQMISRGDDNLVLIDLRSAEEAVLTPHAGPGHFSRGRFSPDGRTVYLSSNKDRELVAFAQVDVGGDGTPGPIEVLHARDDAELAGHEVTEDGTTAALDWNVAGRSELSFLDLSSRTLAPGPTLPAEIIFDLAFSRDGRRLALTLSGSTAPTNIWVLDRPSGRLRQVTHGPHAGVELGALVRPELVRFRAHDGLGLSGWLYRPRDAAGSTPLVLSFHGGPESQERPRFNSTYQALLARGIAVFAPNVRGSSGFGKTFVNLDNGPLRHHAVRDIRDCVDYVVKAGVADSDGIGITGGSYGGFMTMAGLTEHPDAFAAGATVCGIVNFETFFAHTEPWMAAISKVEYGDPQTEVDMLRRLSPIHAVDRVTAATMVLHGANDTNVPVVEAEQVVESLKRRGVPVEYVLFPDEGHGFRRTANRIRATVAIVRWFDEHLKAETD